MYYLVTTTINIPRFLAPYLADFSRYGHEYLFVVVGDKKTPSAARAYCQQFPRVVYLDTADQYRLFRHLKIFSYLPYNSIDRRNLGYLYCFQQGLEENDVLITLDDDNYLKETNYLSRHRPSPPSASLVEADFPTWFNPLERFYRQPVFPRGFSMYQRFPNGQLPLQPPPIDRPLAVNQGVWELNPDVDALTRLQGMSGNYEVTNSGSLLLGHNILCPFDTQNTAYHHHFWLTAFLSPFVGRFDDIFSSYLTKRLADHFGFALAYGSPVVTQHRNDHHLYQDFLAELPGMALTDALVEFLWQLDLSAASLLAAYGEIAQALASDFPAVTLPHGRASRLTRLWSLAQMPTGMQLWLDTLEQLQIADPVPLKPAFALTHDHQ